MGRKKKEKRKWKFFWKNIGGLGVLNRLVAGGIVFAVSYMMKEEDEFKSLVLAAWGAAFIFDAVMHWSVWRAILRRPSKHAVRKRYGEAIL